MHHPCIGISKDIRPSSKQDVDDQILFQELLRWGSLLLHTLMIPGLARVSNRGMRSSLPPHQSER